MGISDAPVVSAARRNTAENTASISDSVKGVCQWCSAAAAGNNNSGSAAMALHGRSNFGRT